MAAFTVTEVDCSTGVSTQRPMTAEEIAAMENHRAAIETQQAEAATKTALKASAKAKLVAGQPLTEEEASVLVL